MYRRANLGKGRVVGVLVISVAISIFGWATLFVILSIETLSSVSQTESKFLAPPNKPPLVLTDPKSKKVEKSQKTLAFVRPQEKPLSNNINGSALIDVPAQPVPPGVKIGNLQYEKCWAADGIEHSGDECGELIGLVSSLEGHLYVLNDCHKRFANRSANEKMTVGLEIDFATSIASVWGGPFSKLKETSMIIECAKDKFAQLSMAGMGPHFERYRIGFSVEFYTPKKTQPIQKARQVSESDHSKQASFKQNATVEVVSDHVRVRKQPIDGKVIGKISSGNWVVLLERKDDWCRIKTPRNRTGWMICWALRLN